MSLSSMAPGAPPAGGPGRIMATPTILFPPHYYPPLPTNGCAPHHGGPPNAPAHILHAPNARAHTCLLISIISDWDSEIHEISLRRLVRPVHNARRKVSTCKHPPLRNSMHARARTLLQLIVLSRLCCTTFCELAAACRELSCSAVDYLLQP